MDDRKHLVELKARFEDHERARAILSHAIPFGVHRQTDTYFALGERRLKLRQVEGQRGALLIYYERPDEAGLKRSEVLLHELPEPEIVKEVLTRVLGVQAIVRKRREIYRHEGVQVHLDEVDGLGRFLELELTTEDSQEGIEAGRAKLASMRATFGIPDEDLVASSYSDLLAD